MKKKVWKSGDCLPPELINALMDLSYSKNANEVGHLPLPENYYNNIQAFKTVDGSVDLSNAKGSAVLVEHEGSSTSLQPVTIHINGVSLPKIIFFVPRGTDYPVNLSVPVTSNARKLINIGVGNAAILSWFGHATQRAWSLYELPKYPIYSATAHYFTEHTDSDSVSLDVSAGFVEIVSSSKIKVRPGNVDFTVQLVVDNSKQDFSGSFTLQVYDVTSKEAVITTPLLMINPGGGNDNLMNFRFAFVAETDTKYSIKARFASQGGPVRVSNVNVAGTWIEW